MELLRKKSDLDAVFPEYYCLNDVSNAKLSDYVIFQRVDSNTVILFSLVTDAIIVLTDEEYMRIQKMDFEDDMMLYHFLNDNGVFVHKDLNEFEVMMRHRERINNSISQTLKVVIMPTTACNARCGYCIGHNNSTLTMTPEIAKKVVDYIVKLSAGYKSLKFDWYGGEPLIKSELITYICDEVHNRLPNVSYTSVVTTNLVLLDENLVQTMTSSWHVEKVNVTIDGDEEEHNNRKQYLQSTFNGYKHTIKCIELLLKNNIRVFCRYNIDRNNINKLETVLTSLKDFVNNSCFYFFISPLRGDEDNAYFALSEYNELFYKTGKLLNENGIHNHIDSFVPKSMMKYCIAKSDNCIVIGPNGNLYRCNIDQLNKHNSTGDIYEGMVKTNAFYSYMGSKLDDKCIMCKYLPICQGGCLEQAKHESSSNSQCDKFKFKIGGISKLLAEFYRNH